LNPRWLPTVRQLLLALNAFVLVLPVLLILGLRVDDAELVQQTERRLIGESVVIAEAWRGHYLEALGAPERASAAAARPPAAPDERYAPIDPRSDVGFRVEPPEPGASRSVVPGRGPAWLAGARVSPLLERALVFNLSGARVLDRDGCIVATSGEDLGDCLDGASEVRAALAGDYAVVVRERISDEPTPPLWSMRRRGDHRVYTATPIHQEGEVIGVVRMSRTAVAPEEWLWRNRGSVLLLAGLCALLVPVITYSLSHAISLPLRRIARAAQAVSDGEDPGPLAPRGVAPREVRALAAALERMRETIERRADFIESFTTEVGHELKTPVTSIRGAAELLRDGWETMDEMQRDRFLANLESDAGRLEDLVRQLLALARIEHDPEPGEPIEVTSFFESLCERYTERVSLEVAPGLGSVVMSRERLEAAVRNLVENGLLHGAGSEVCVSVARHAARLRVTVSDRGPGIPEGAGERIFERFYTTARDTGGTGLGLAIVKAVADARDGSVEVESSEAGTTFTLTL
jgi:signal transduction histidine kinase